MTPPSSAIADRKAHEAETLPEKIAGFKNKAFGMYVYPESYFDDLQKVNKDFGATEYWSAKYTNTLADDQTFLESLDGVLDVAPFSIYAAAFTPASQDGRDYARRAFKAMLSSPGVLAIKAVTTKHTLATCIEGSVRLIGELRELQSETQKRDLQLKFIEGPYNHSIHVQAPEVLWSEIL